MSRSKVATSPSVTCLFTSVEMSESTDVKSGGDGAGHFLLDLVLAWHALAGVELATTEGQLAKARCEKRLRSVDTGTKWRRARQSSQ